MEHAPRILKISEVGAAEVDSEVAGLADLHQMGLSVPGAFVALDAREAELPENLEEHYAALGGGAVAVRSAAIGEDGQDASCAGRYATALNVRGVEGLRRAIGVCVRWLSSAAVDAYHAEQADGGSEVGNTRPILTAGREYSDNYASDDAYLPRSGRR